MIAIKGLKKLHWISLAGTPFQILACPLASKIQISCQTQGTTQATSHLTRQSTHDSQVKIKTKFRHEMSQGEVNSSTMIAQNKFHFKPQESLPLKQSGRGPRSTSRLSTCTQDPNQLPNTRYNTSNQPFAQAVNPWFPSEGWFSPPQTHTAPEASLPSITTQHQMLQKHTHTASSRIVSP